MPSLISEFWLIDISPSLCLSPSPVGGIPIDYIIEFFRQPNIYHHVLSRYNGITADDR